MPSAHTAARNVGVLVAAGGSGTRIGGDIPKQFQPIAGVPMLLRTLRPFTAHPRVLHTVIALPAASAAAPPAWLVAVLGDGLAAVPGGPTRADSVRAALRVLDPECAVVLVHDAARPFVARETIDAVIDAADGGVGAVPGVPVTDTVKRVVDGLVSETVSRDGLWRAQTPQGFPRHVLEAAFEAAKGRESTFTDDAAMVEALGIPIVLVADASANLKVTTPEDFLLAEAMAGQ